MHILSCYHAQLTKYNNMTGLTLEQREKLLTLREAIIRSEALYKERHNNIYDVDNDSDEDVDEDQIYSYYFTDEQEENESENDVNEGESESGEVIYDIPTSSCDYASYVVDQLLYGHLRNRVHLLPGGDIRIILSEQCSATL